VRRTRIVCTLGPSSTSPSVVRRLIAAGMDVARLNFSYGDADQHRQAAGRVREAARAAGRHVALLQDLQGPKVRAGTLEPPVVSLVRGRQVTLTAQPLTGNAALVPISHRQLIDTLLPGDRVLLADGQIELRVVEVRGTEARCTIARGGLLEARKGVIAPGRGTDLPAPWLMRLYGFGIGLAGSLMGVSGGSLSNMVLTLYGKSIHQAVATSAGLGVPVTIVGTLGYILAGSSHYDQLPPLSLGFVSLIGVALMAPVSSFTAPYGARLAHRLPRRALEVLFACFLLLISLRFVVSTL